MLWLILSLLTAFTVATHDAWVKKFFSDLNVYEMAAYPFVFSFPLFLAATLLVPVPPLDATFYWCFLASLPLNGVSFVLYMKAIQVSPLSLTVPYLTLTPAFMIITGYIFLNETMNIWGLLGILITCAGGYLLNFENDNRQLFAPFKVIFRETGSWLMLIVAFLFSFAGVIGKKAILHSSPLFFQMSFFAALNFLMPLLLWIFRKIRFRTFTRQPIQGLMAGLLLFFHALLHGFAISLTKAAYMISVKRFSVLFGIIYGGLLFKEKHMATRFCGTLLMLSGAVMIILRGH